MKGTRRRGFFKMVGFTAIGGCLIKNIVTMHAQDKREIDNKEFAPGEKVPVSGVYEVTHDKLDGDDQAQQHQDTFTAGDVFPRCKGCGELVRFRFHEAVEQAGPVSPLAP